LYLALDPIEVIGPFVALLQAPFLAAPYKSVALDAIHSFVGSNILCEKEHMTGDALTEVVDAVTR